MNVQSRSTIVNPLANVLAVSRVGCVYICLAGFLLLSTHLTAAEILDAESVWRPEVEQLYHADVYHSEDAAVNYLAHELRRQVDSPQDVGFRIEDDSKLSRRLGAAMQSAGLETNETGTAIRVRREKEDDHGVIRLLTTIGDQPIDLTANFVNERWVTADPSTDEFVVVRGTSPADSAIIVGARKHVLPRILEHPRLRSVSKWERRIAEKAVRKGLNRSPIIEDRFRQTFYKTINDERHEAFSREALLLNLSKKNVDEIAHAVHRDVRRGRRIRSEAIGFSSVAVFVTCVLCWIGYTFFNRVTQGYYVWPIRLVTTGVLLLTVTLAAGITIAILNSV